MTGQKSIPIGNDHNKSPSLAYPELKNMLGSVTKKVQRRALLVYFLVVLLGMAVSYIGNSDQLKAFGLGLVIPGGGLVYTGQWISLVLTCALFAVTFLLWFASGNIIGPPGVWLGSAAYAAFHAGHPHMSANHTFALWLVPTVVAAGFAYIAWARSRSFKKGLITRAKRNNYLSDKQFTPTEVPSFQPEFWRELTLDELKEARFLFDRALQPLDSYEGFDWVEFQFQFAAVRYQLNTINYTLALMNYHSTLSFRGYLQQAQKNTIDKLLNKRVWGYWRWESLWGNFTTDFDPIKKDNIMLSGWSGMAMGVYALVTGDDHYTKSGSMTFRYDDKSYAYDIHSMANCVYENFKQSEWTLFPCEPNWIYNMCNETGFTFLQQHDRLYGTGYATDIALDYTDTIDNEFTTVDGRVIALRSQRLGFSIPLLTSPLADASFGTWSNATKPLHAQRVWHIFRNEFVTIEPSGDVSIKTKGWDEIDAGNYRLSLISTLGACRCFALEMGDEDLAEKLKFTARKKYPYIERNGINYYPEASSLANIMNCYGTMHRHNAWAQLNQFDLPERVFNGPLLTSCSYPEILVAKAVSHTGTDIELVLYAGSENRVQQIVISHLSPETQYLVFCSTDNYSYSQDSDSNGELHLVITLHDRTLVSVKPT